MNSIDTAMSQLEAGQWEAFDAGCTSAPDKTAFLKEVVGKMSQGSWIEKHPAAFDHVYGLLETKQLKPFALQKLAASEQTIKQLFTRACQGHNEDMAMEILQYMPFDAAKEPDYVGIACDHGCSHVAQAVLERQTRFYQSAAKVVEGLWSTTFKKETDQLITALIQEGRKDELLELKSQHLLPQDVDLVSKATVAGKSDLAIFLFENQFPGSLDWNRHPAEGVPFFILQKGASPIQIVKRAIALAQEKVLNQYKANKSYQDVDWIGEAIGQNKMWFALHLLDEKFPGHKQYVELWDVTGGKKQNIFKKDDPALSQEVQKRLTGWIKAGQIELIKEVLDKKLIPADFDCIGVALANDKAAFAVNLFEAGVPGSDNYQKVADGTSVRKS